jgi:hypothetical protein
MVWFFEGVRGGRLTNDVCIIVWDEWPPKQMLQQGLTTYSQIELYVPYLQLEVWFDIFQFYFFLFKIGIG